MNIKTKLLWQTFFTTAIGIAAIAIVNVASVNFISDQIGKEGLATKGLISCICGIIVFSSCITLNMLTTIKQHAYLVITLAELAMAISGIVIYFGDADMIVYAIPISDSLFMSLGLQAKENVVNDVFRGDERSRLSAVLKLSGGIGGVGGFAIARECTNLSMHDIGILAVLVACWFEFVHIQGVYWCKKMK